MSYFVFLGVAVSTATLMVGLIRLRNMKNWGKHNVADEIDVRGKVVVITGATSGIGKEVAYELLQRGAIVVIPARTLGRAVEAEADLKKRLGTFRGTIVPMEMDMSSLASVRAFADKLKATFDKIHILINNAGVYGATYDKDKVTSDGFEYNFGINYVSHFLLTNLFLEECKAAASNGECSRIVNVSSMLHEKGELRLDNLNYRNLSTEDAKPVKPYSNSKLAQVYFSQELAKRFSVTGVHSYCLCPGWVYTNLARDVTIKWYQYIGILPFAAIFMKTPKQGSQTVLHCALSKECEIETGKLYRNCGIWRSSALPLSEHKANLLWEKTVELVGDYLQ